MITKLRALRLAEMKARGPLRSFIPLVIAEVEKIGKNDGDRVTTNDEAVTVLKKLIASNVGVIATVGAEKASVNVLENAFMEDLLPKMATEDEMSAFVDGLIAGGASHIKDVMGPARKEFGAAGNMKFISMYAASKF